MLQSQKSKASIPYNHQEQKKNNRPIPKSDNLRQNEKVFFKPHNKYGTDPILTKALACDSAHVRYYILF